MLQRRGRMTYGALKRQFNLADAYLKDLKAEIIKAQRLAVDENGEVLVWSGSAASSSRIVKIFKLAFPREITPLPSSALRLVFCSPLTDTQRQ
jgi:hypothetical protein